MKFLPKGIPILSEGKSDSLRTKINLENNHDMTVIRIFARDIMK